MKRRDLLKALPVAGAAISLPALAGTPMSAEDRVRFHFAELAKAMDDITAHCDGWRMVAGARGEKLLYVNPTAEPHAHFRSVHFEKELVFPDGRAMMTSLGGVRAMRTHTLVDRSRALFDIRA